METKKIKELTWMGKFRFSEGGHIHTITALVRNDEIGCYNPFGTLVFADRDTEVIPEAKEEN